MHTSHYSRLEEPNIPIADCHPSKTTTYILHVVSITTHTRDRHKSNGEKEKKIKERKEERRKTKQNEKGKQREEKDKKSWL